MALFVLSLCPFDISVGVGAFVIGLSEISSFFSLKSSKCVFDVVLYMLNVVVLVIKLQKKSIFIILVRLGENANTCFGNF